MQQAHENQIAKLIEQLEEANVLLQRAAHTSDMLAKTFRQTLNSHWLTESPDGPEAA